MVVAKKMSKPVLKVSMDSESEEESSSTEGPSESENEAENSNNAEAEVEFTNSDIGENADAESDDSDGEDNSNEDVLISNEGWADSIAKILGSNKPKNKKTLVLSRAKKHSVMTKVVKDAKPEFEVIGDNEKEEKIAVKKEESIVSEPPPKKTKHSKPSIRIKPNVLEKDRERLLSKIATKGVVQLFNAVRNQQKTIQSEMDRNDLPESKKEKILKKFDKRAFLDTLMGQSKSIVVDEETRVTKNEVKDEDKLKWGALRDDFMMGAKMKDWDKESVDE
ncbi:unnamed protein product [Arctia plantaginis]|uniref:RRP15-like protein n=1 Tax=Arctia plantaginis TaxID=874455 RepID=A0A8S1AVN0_ARCPL|nr:unnamed protein product [Arctia plantaginis]